MKPLRSRGFLPFVCCLAASSALSHAELLYWDNGTTTGAWNDPANWSTDPDGTTNPAAFPGAADDAYFSASTVTGAQTVYLNANRSVNSLTFANTEAFEIRSSSNTSEGPFTLNITGDTPDGVAIHVLAGSGAVSIGSGNAQGNPIRMTNSQSWINDSTDGTLTFGNSVAFTGTGDRTLTIGGAGNTTISAAIQGAPLSLTKTGAGTLTFSGGNSNSYAGLTTISGGTLNMNKGSGVNAISGDILLNGGILRWANNNNQIADTASIQMESGTITLNNRTETLAGITATGGSISTGTGHLTLTGTLSLDSPDNSTRLTVNSGGSLTADSIILTGVNRPLGGTSGGNVLVGSNHESNLTQLVVGPGGLSMSGQTIQFNWSNDGRAGGQLVLNGNFTGTGNNTIGNANSGGGGQAPNSTLNLGDTTRTFNVTGGTTSINLPILGEGGLTKTGDGILDLSGASTYTGATTVNAGELRASGELNSTTALDVTGGIFTYGADHIVNDTAAVLLGTGGVLRMATFTDALGSLTVTGNPILDLIGGGHVTFADSSASAWDGLLTVVGWNDDTASVSFTTASGLTSGQLASVFFENPEGFDPGLYTARWDGLEIVPDVLVPEPSTLLLTLGGLTTLLIRRRR